MYKIGDTVLHPTAGVCKIANIKSEDFLGLGLKEFYVLNPVYDKGQIIHSPVDSVKITLRRVLSEKEIYSLIHSVSCDEPLWTDNDAMRKEIFSKTLKTDDQAKIIQLIIEICEKRKEKTQNGKKLHISDESILHEAERIIHQEFAYALNINVDSVAQFIMKELNIE